MFPVVSYKIPNVGRHRVVLVDTDKGFKCVDPNYPHQVLIDASFLDRYGQFIFQRVIYIRKAGTIINIFIVPFLF
jgi:hypothetical protein